MVKSYCYPKELLLGCTIFVFTLANSVRRVQPDEILSEIKSFLEKKGNSQDLHYLE